MAMAQKGITCLTSEQILKRLPQIGIQLDLVTLQDIKTPKSDTILKLYGDICINLELGLEGDTQQLMFNAMEFMEDPELHRKSGQVAHMVFSLQRILQFAGVKDFKVDDIVNPDPKRTRKILSVLISYSQYCGVKYARIGKKKDEASEILNHVDQMEIEINNLKSKINKKAVDVARLRSVAKDFHATETTYKELTDKKVKVMQDYQEVKSKISEVETVLSSHRVSLCEVESKKQELLQSIVQSPERVQSEMVRLSQEIDATIAEQKTKREEIDLLENELQELKLLQASLLGELNKNVCNATELANRLEDYKEESLEMEKRQQTVRQQLEEMPSKLDILEKKLVMQCKMNRKEMAQLNARLEDRKKLLVEKEKKWEQLQGRSKQNQKEHVLLDEEEDKLNKAIRIEERTIDYILEKTREDLDTIRSWAENEKQRKEAKAAEMTEKLETLCGQKRGYPVFKVPTDMP